MATQRSTWVSQWLVCISWEVLSQLSHSQSEQAWVCSFNFGHRTNFSKIPKNHVIRSMQINKAKSSQTLCIPSNYPQGNKLYVRHYLICYKSCPIHREVVCTCYGVGMWQCDYKIGSTIICHLLYDKGPKNCTFPLFVGICSSHITYDCDNIHTESTGGSDLGRCMWICTDSQLARWDLNQKC